MKHSFFRNFVVSGIKTKGHEKVFKEDLENGYTDTAIVCKKLKSSFSLGVFDKKKEKVLILLCIKSKRVVEMKQRLMNQIRMKLKIEMVQCHTKHHWKTIIKD